MSAGPRNEKSRISLTFPPIYLRHDLHDHSIIFYLDLETMNMQKFGILSSLSRDEESSVLK